MLFVTDKLEQQHWILWIFIIKLKCWNILRRIIEELICGNACSTAGPYRHSADHYTSRPLLLLLLSSLLLMIIIIQCILSHFYDAVRGAMVFGRSHSDILVIKTFSQLCIRRKKRVKWISFLLNHIRPPNDSTAEKYGRGLLYIINIYLYTPLNPDEDWIVSANNTSSSLFSLMLRICLFFHLEAIFMYDLMECWAVFLIIRFL